MLLNCNIQFLLKSTFELSQKAYKLREIWVIWAIVKKKSMKSPSEKEFKESIKELSEYKNRLEEEVTIISKKLKMPQEKIKSIINSHQEINEVKKILSNLKRQKENMISKIST